MNLILFAILLVGCESTAQSTKFPTTFEKTDLLIKEGQLDQAYKLMKRYQKLNPNDFNAAWKTAQLAYWNSDRKASKLFYDKAITLDSTSILVKYDYAKMLFDIGAYKEASVLFSACRAIESESAEIWLYSIKSFYYDNALNSAIDLYKQMPEKLNSNPELSDLKSEILTFQAATISVSFSFIDDNQPMQTIIPKIRISKMHNSNLNWFVEGTVNSFKNNTLSENSKTFKVGNQFKFSTLKLTAVVFVGATILSAANKSAAIGGLQLSKRLGKGFALNAELSRNPYYYSLASTQNFVLQDNLGIALSIHDLYNFSGNIQLQKQLFNDANSIAANSFWIFSPGVGPTSFKTKIGYAFEAADAEKDNFTSVKPLANIIQDFGTTASIQGVYNFYFTPQNQKAHSVLLAIELKLNPKLDIHLTGSYGFSAKWDNPYLFLNKNSADELFIDKGFTSEEFKPATYKADVSYKLSRKLNIGLNYQYFKTAFYTANTCLLNVNYKLLREK